MGISISTGDGMDVCRKHDSAQGCQLQTSKIATPAATPIVNPSRHAANINHPIFSLRRSGFCFASTDNDSVSSYSSAPTGSSFNNGIAAMAANAQMYSADVNKRDVSHAVLGCSMCLEVCHATNKIRCISIFDDEGLLLYAAKSCGSAQQL